ncbi:hypothetical protein SAMN05421813_1321 [Daejeonella rubra]|uniref:Uncharacterized protein n=1 Tax=Daejeonella rubra TaxID=990371 RepID=A0A1G9XRL9_9SPHI|nr:hypothetical protein SAMN05421813_1321 [Daejeonella rubra]
MPLLLLIQLQIPGKTAKPGHFKYSLIEKLRVKTRERIFRFKSTIKAGSRFKN